MRITVDGKPIDDPGRSSSDIQRCTDVALDNAKIHFRFDNLEARRRLGVAANPVAVAVGDSGGGRPLRSCISGCTATMRASSSMLKSEYSSSRSPASRATQDHRRR